MMGPLIRTEGSLPQSAHEYGVQNAYPVRRTFARGTLAGGYVGAQLHAKQQLRVTPSQDSRFVKRCTPFRCF